MLCCSSSRPTTSRTQLDLPLETVEMDETEMRGASRLCL